MLIGTSTVAPFAFTWKNAPQGGYFLTAVATDSLGATATSAATQVTVGGSVNQAPVIVNPAASNSNPVIVNNGG